MTKTIIIMEHVIPMLDKKVQFINKKAQKIGLQQLQYKVIEEKVIDNIKFVSIEIEYEVVQIKGYKPIAVIEHVGKELNIINKIDFTSDIPKEYFTAKSICQHCNSNRVRKTTILLQSECGQLIQVGKSCLKDFIGHNIETAISFYESICCLEELQNMSDGPTLKIERYFDIRKVLQMAIAIIEKEGYVNKELSLQKFQTQTGQKAWTFCEDVHIGRSIDSQYADEYKQVYKDENIPQEVEDVINWIEQNNAESEYMQNLKNIIKLGSVKSKHSNILASAIPCYRRHKAIQEQQNKRQQLKNEWFGEVGKRLDLSLKCISCIETQGFYGTTFINKFLDEQGRLFVWFTTTNSFEQDEEVILKATIKEHSEFREQKQTIITRCKVL